MADERKLQIDDDWKNQAAAEKERLAQTVEHEDRPGGGLKADFKGLISLLTMQAMVGLGGFAGPGGQEVPPNPALAKHYIDLLDALDEKTKGNLDAEEKRILDTTLHQLRMAYVETVGAGGRGPMAPTE